MSKIFANFWNDFKQYIILCILLVTSLALTSQESHPSINNFKTFLFGNFAFVTSFFPNLFSVRSDEDELIELRKQNAALMLQVNQLREYAIVNEELKSLLNFKDTSSIQVIPAKIIYKTITTSQNTITLNCGREDSVEIGMPVVNDLGLVGLVHGVTQNFCIVRTLQNINMKVAVKNQFTRYQGILRWNGESLQIINLPKTALVSVGDRILTSEISSIINLPLPVGFVSKIHNAEKGIFHDVVIQPFVDFDRIENVFVLKNKTSIIKRNVEMNLHIGRSQ